MRGIGRFIDVMQPAERERVKMIELNDDLVGLAAERGRRAN